MRGKGDQETQDIQSAKCLQPSSDVREARRMSTQDSLFIQILSAHPEIKQSQRTLYYYIESGVFKDFGVDCFSLKEQVNRKQFSEKYKKRKEPSCYAGREYSDFLKFREENPETPPLPKWTQFTTTLQGLIFKPL